MRRVFGGATKKPWHRLLIGIALLLLLLVAAAVFFVATFDANSHKVRVAAMVKEKIGRELSIPGAVRLKLFPKLRLELDRAVLNEKNSTQAFATIEAVKLSLRPWPLINGEVLLDQMEIGNFDVKLKRFANGTTNFDDLISKDESPPTLHFDLAGLTIKSGTLHFDDEIAQRKTQISNLKVTTGRLTDNVPSPISAQFLLANDNPASALQADLAGELTFDLRRKRYRMKSLKVQAQGEAVALKALTIALSANIDADLQAGHIGLQGTKMSFEGKSGVQSLHGEFAAPMIASEPNKVSLQNVTAQFKLEELSKKIGVNLNVASVGVANNKVDAPNVALTFSVDQDTLRSSGEVATAFTMDLSEQRASLASLKFTSKTQRDQMTLDFSALGPIALDLKTGALDATQLNGEWQLQNQHDQLKGNWRAPIAANIADSSFTIDALQGDWSGTLAGATVTGRASVPISGNWRDYGGKIPTIDLQTTLTWPDSALEANIHADLQASSEANQVSAKGAAIKASGFNPNGKWQADLASPANVDFAAQVAELPKLVGNVRWIGKNKMAKPINVKLNGAGKVDFPREQAQFKLKAALDQSKFDGTFGMTGWADPAYRIDANLDQLDVDQYFPSTSTPSTTKAKPSKAPPVNFDLTFLKTLRVDGRINIGRLKSSGTSVRKVHIELESATPKKISQ